jgi:hypothetical protein
MQSHSYDIRKMIGYEVLQPALKAARESETKFLALVNLGTTSRVINECLMDCYKTMIPIEVIPKTEKWDLWNFAKEKWPEATREQLKDKCLYIYIIGNLF